MAAVIEGSPAESQIRKGDLITAVDGRPVSVAADLVAATAGTEPGEHVRVTVVRGGHTTTVDVPAEPVRSEDRPALGVLVRAEDFDVQLPFTVSVADGWVGGPSAGLMLALAIYDLVSAEDLTAGRVIAGTGAIDVTGRVGPVAGVAAKVEAARRAGASLFLVPASQAGDAVNVGGENLTVVPVAHISEAIAALRRGG